MTNEKKKHLKVSKNERFSHMHVLVLLVCHQLNWRHFGAYLLFQQVIVFLESHCPGDSFFFRSSN